MPNDDWFTVGYDEDGIMWVAGVPDAAAAELAIESWPGEWRAVSEGHVCFLECTDGKHEKWEECAGDAPGAERAWRVVDVARPMLLDENEELQPNPHYDPGCVSGPE